jgi:hypothetical protein
MRRLGIIFIFCLAFAQTGFAQQFFGRVKEQNGEAAIAGASIKLNDIIIAQTNQNGYFSFEYIGSETIETEITAFGFEPVKTTLLAGEENIISLSTVIKNLETVSVMSYRLKRGNNSFSYTIDNVKGLGSVLGEIDVLRYISILPGVSQGIEGGLSNFVRGGGNGNNRVELDQVPVYGSSHLLGLFSVFPPTIVKDANLQMGGISALSGNTLSSVLQINTITPDLDSVHYDFSISPLMVNAATNGYFAKGKFGYQIAGRTSLLPLEYALIKSLTKQNMANLAPRINDLYTSFYYRFNEKENLKGTFYVSNDFFNFDFRSNQDGNDLSRSEFGISWGNLIGKIEWNKTINSYWNTRVFISANRFNSKQRQQIFDKGGDLESGLLMNNSITEYAAKGIASYQRNSINLFFGGNYSNFKFQPATQKVLTSSKSTQDFSEIYTPSLTTVFSELQYTPSAKIKTKIDLRGNYYALKKYTFFTPDIRFLSSYFLWKNFGIEATYDYNNQFFHVLEGLPIGWSIDLNVPAASHYQPESSHQFYLGMFGGTDVYYATLGGYLKKMQNLAYYKTTENLFGVRNGSWEESIVTGEGTSRGVELWIEKRQGFWTWSFAYTLSKSDRQFNEINEGKIFPFKFDRHHNLNYQSKYTFKKAEKREKNFHASFYFSSGNRIIIPLGHYEGVLPPFWEQQDGALYIPPIEDENAYSREEMSAMNDYQMPNYMRMDIGYSTIKKKKKFSREFTFSIFNVLNRHNPYLIFYDNDDSKWKQLSILPIVPSVMWKIWF